jgi:hypothetical protein
MSDMGDVSDMLVVDGKIIDPNEPKPEFSGWLAFFLFVCLFFGPIGWLIIGGTLWYKLCEHVDWVEKQKIAAILASKESE